MRDDHHQKRSETTPGRPALTHFWHRPGDCRRAYVPPPLESGRCLRLPVNTGVSDTTLTITDSIGDGRGWSFKAPLFWPRPLPSPIQSVMVGVSLKNPRSEPSFNGAVFHKYVYACNGLVAWLRYVANPFSIWVRRVRINAHHNRQNQSGAREWPNFPGLLKAI
jgi:hypothetical protein